VRIDGFFTDTLQRASHLNSTIHVIYYSSSGKHEVKDVIAQEHFPYLSRPKEEEVAQAFTDRQLDRQRGAPKEKIIIPVIAIPGSPGSGKSTFLKNFPISQAYRSYLESYYKGRQPIVSLITFNSSWELSGNRDLNIYLGLRILYGAMVYHNRTNISYCNFIDYMIEGNQEAEKIDVGSVHNILLEYSASDGPILLGVDELSKCKSDAEDVLRRIGYMLDLYDDVDVVVCTLINISPL
jgi:hypothetical protein